MSATLAAPAPAPAGSAKLTGTVLGTAGSYKNGGNTAANAFDGNANTYFDGPASNGDWVGLDLGSVRSITQVQFAPRSGWAGRMVGGVFQASTTPDFSAGVTTLYAVTATPAAGFTVVPVTPTGLVEFVRYVAPAGSYGNVAEIEFDGSAQETAAPAAPTAVAATASYTGVALTWAGDPTTPTDTYTVQRQGPTDAAFVTLGTTAGVVTTFTDTAVAPSTTYAYQVIATNGIGTSVASAAATATTPAPYVNPWSDADVGSPGLAGSVVATPATVTVTGGGADIWNQTDQFNYADQTLTGNGTVTVQVTGQTNSNAWAKGGIMVRESANADSRFVLLALTPGNGVTWQVRSATHAMPTYTTAAGKAGVWLQVTRVGSTFTGLTSTDGVTWKQVGTATITMPNNVTAGLAVSAHDNARLSTVTFANPAVTATGTAASTWSLGAAGPMTRWESETFSYGGQLYVFGGFTDRNLDATAEGDAYNPATNTWSPVTTIPVGGLTHASVAVVGDLAYFAGGTIGTFSGHSGATTSAAVLTYNLTTGTWGSTTSLPAPMSCGGLVAVNNALYYYGGLNAANTADLNTTYALDLSNPSAGWVAKAALPNGRNHLGAVAINGVAYAVGGWHVYNTKGGNVAEVDAYNPVTDTWSAVAALPNTLSSIETSTMVVNGKIVVVGGGSNGGYDGIYQAAILAYDPAANAWSTAGTLPEANEGMSVADVNGQLIVADGTVDNQGGWSQDQVWSTTAITI